MKVATISLRYLGEDDPERGQVLELATVAVDTTTPGPWPELHLYVQHQRYTGSLNDLHQHSDTLAAISRKTDEWKTDRPFNAVGPNITYASSVRPVLTDFFRASGVLSRSEETWNSEVTFVGLDLHNRVLPALRSLPGDESYPEASGSSFDPRIRFFNPTKGVLPTLDEIAYVLRYPLRGSESDTLWEARLLAAMLTYKGGPQ